MLPYANDVKQAEEEESYDYEKAKEIKWYHQILLNRPLKVIIVVLLIAVIAPLLIYQLIFFSSMDLPPPDGYSIGSCLLPRSARLPCGVGIVNDTDCHSQCCYDYTNNLCFHRFPSRFSYITDRGWSEEILLQPRVATVPYKNQDSVAHIRISFDEISSTHLAVTFYNSVETILEGKRIEDKDYIYHVSSPEMNVMVNGTNNNTLFNTLRGPLIASEDIWEIAFKLTEDTMYGLGEIPLEKDTVKVIYSFDRGLSAVPLIFARANDSYHGLLIDIKEPTEVRIQGENQIVIRSITNHGLKFHLFVGPQPRDIMRDVMNLIGMNKDLEYWMLGAHVCSESSDTLEEALHDLDEFLTASEDIPFDSHCGLKPVVFESDLCETEDDAIDYMERGAQLVKHAGKRYVPHVSPYIRFEEEEESDEDLNEEINDEFDHIKTISDSSSEANNKCPNIFHDLDIYMMSDHESKEIYKGKVGDHKVIYPDYERVNDEFLKKLWRKTIKPDGVILENNWPLDETNKSHTETYDALAYYSENFEEAFNKTPQWNIFRPNGEKYIYTHNTYGESFTNAFKKSFQNIPISSTSTWQNGEVVVNRQNIDTSWTNLQNELVEAALGGVSGHWLWTSPVCGDTENYNTATQTSLCVKWYMAATYMPLIKIHSKDATRNPLVSFVGTNKIYITTALNHRSSLLPYFYTTLQNGPLLRPMFYQFPFSEEIKDLKSQFSVGDDLLIVPNLQPSQSHVHLWMPPGSWYELWSGLPLDEQEGQAVTMTTTEADFLTLIRGGSIIVVQKDVKKTAEETRLQSEFSLTIALECETTLSKTTEKLENTTTTCYSEGTLYMSKSMTLTFEADSEELTITAEGDDFAVFCNTHRRQPLWASKIQEINVYGLNDGLNNYDYHRHISTLIDLCDLENRNKIVFSLVL